MTAQATFGMGCFWKPDVLFIQSKGVIQTEVGFMGGNLENPTYEDVCHTNTGHAEVVQVTYDPKKITYDELLKIFWENHNPTTLNRQGPDVGEQYRSTIFYHDEKEKALAEKSKMNIEKSGKFKNPIVTQIIPAKKFFKAEEYHQKYLIKNRGAFC